MKKRISLVVLILILLLSSTVSVFAETSTDYKNKIDEANKQIELLDGKIDKELQEVEDYNQQIENAQSEINTLTTELTELEKSIKIKEKELVEKKEVLEDRMVAMYMAGETTYLDVLLSGGFLDFVSNYYLVTQIVEYDTNLINEVEEIKNTLETQKQQIETKKEEKQDAQNRLKQLKADKQASVDKLSTEQKQLQTQVDSWDAKMKELEELERNLNSSGSSEYDGSKLQWPAPSSKRITSNYGYRLHPIYNTYKLHSGIDIGAGSGSAIVAAESGTVILSSYGYNGGYGNYIIINHGNGLTTRYAHCSSLNVSVGQKVTRGQVIAAVGSTGASTGPHLHFEVRINGASQNPVNYL